MSNFVETSTEAFDSVTYDGVELTEIIYNGVTVWQGGLPPIDPEILQDFNYKVSNGACVLTGWKQTYNGVSSTECIIPDNDKIML